MVLVIANGSTVYALGIGLKWEINYGDWYNYIPDNKKGLPVWIALSLNGSLAMCYSRMGVEAEFFRNTVPTAGTSQAALGSGNPLCEGFLLSSIARQRLYEKSPVVRLSFFV
jgi:hypothetical protein